ncbi:MAG TPA: hypothetical protein VMV49_08835 [Candidatus Deferrimicrobium sp.]|nr:hypothetical protein [Candidatus Deferrimicrobium sp.]
MDRQEKILSELKKFHQVKSYFGWNDTSGECSYILIENPRD